MVLFVSLELKCAHPRDLSVPALLLAQMRRLTIPLTAARTSAINEILNGMKLIKLYAWEMSFAEKVTEMRRLEIAQLLRSSWAYGVQMTLSWTMPVMVSGWSSSAKLRRGAEGAVTPLPSGDLCHIRGALGDRDGAASIEQGAGAL